MIWWKVPGGPLETFGDLEGDLIADRIGVASKWVVDVENEEFLGTVMELSLETADLAPLKTHLDALILSNHTPNTRTPRSPLRI